MNRLYRLVLQELAGPWCFGVAIFTILIVTMLYMLRFTEMMVRGVDPATVLYLAILSVPAVLVKTFAMAALLAGLLAFGRLSGDSEIVALRAAGASIGRAMMPVAWFGIVIAAVAFGVDECVVPIATQRAESLQTELAKKLRAQDLNPTGYPIRDKDGKLIAQLNAREFDLQQQVLRGVTVIFYKRLTDASSADKADDHKSDTKPGRQPDDPGFINVCYLEAPELKFQTEMTDTDWRITKGARLVAADGSSTTIVGTAWPANLPKLTAKPEDILSAMTRNLDNFSMKQFREAIEKAKKEKLEHKTIANLEYGYYNKIALPLAVFVFGLLGAALGIRNHRTGVAGGYMIAIVIIFCYLQLANLMAVFANRGSLAPYVASFTPLVVGCVAAVVTIHQRNQA